MKESGVAAVLASSPMGVAYLTGFDCWLYQRYTEDMLVLGAPRAPKEAFAFLGQEGAPVLVADTYSSLFAWELEGVELRCYGSAALTVAERGSRTRHAAYFGGAQAGQRETPALALSAALEEAGITGGRVAVEMASMRPETLKALRRALPGVEFVDGWLLLALIRMVKSEAEVGFLTKAARVNEHALYQSLVFARPGAPLGELARRYMIDVAREGAVYDHYFVSPDGLGVSGASGYRLRRGEHTMVDSGCTFNRYCADMGTTILLGREEPAVVRRYGEIWETVDEIADWIEPGVTPTAVMERFGALYEKERIPTQDYAGHGIGLEPREYPIMGLGRARPIRDGVVATTTDLPLEPGMVISLETSVYEPGEGSYEVERTFLVGRSSLKELTTKKDSAIFVTPG
jgi:Xaa-Pro aminopeptidase